MSKPSVALAAVLMTSASAQAHHSTTHFSPEFTEMEGTLVDIRWRNPHIYFGLEVEEEDGSTRLWDMEAGTIYMIGRAGVTRDMFSIGDRVRVAGNRSTVYDDKFWLTNVLLPEGREVLVVGRGTPRWADELIGGSESMDAMSALHDDYDERCRPRRGILSCLESARSNEAGIVIPTYPDQRSRWPIS